MTKFLRHKNSFPSFDQMCREQQGEFVDRRKCQMFNGTRKAKYMYFKVKYNVQCIMDGSFCSFFSKNLVGVPLEFCLYIFRTTVCVFPRVLHDSLDILFLIIQICIHEYL